VARRGSTKRRSVDHEDYIARLYNGKRSASSGGADNDNGDVRSETLLIECKMTGGPGEKPKPLPKFVQHLEKVAEEAYLEGREPVVALRYFAPHEHPRKPSGVDRRSSKASTE
jgi:hypothetical protein